MTNINLKINFLSASNNECRDALAGRLYTTPQTRINKMPLYDQVVL
ncbi:MAG: hypothetical protein AAB332_06350 [Planctomycetota bacterium]